VSDKQTPPDRAGLSFREHQASVYRYLLRRVNNHHEAEELTQRVFVDAAAALSDPNCRPDSMLAWLYTIAERRLVDELRRRTGTSAHLRQLPRNSMAADDAYGPALADAIRRSIERLPSSQRRVVVMKVFEGRPFAEIAEVVESSEAACKMRFSRAIRLVRAALAAVGTVKPRGSRSGHIWNGADDASCQPRSSRYGRQRAGPGHSHPKSRAGSATSAPPHMG
jgi:RNA polymerase sigma-70 factor (ECF subfamily)